MPMYLNTAGTLETEKSNITNWTLRARLTIWLFLLRGRGELRYCSLQLLFKDNDLISTP